jgi:hypothetical protein
MNAGIRQPKEQSFECHTSGPSMNDFTQTETNIQKHETKIASAQSVGDSWICIGNIK